MKLEIKQEIELSPKDIAEIIREYLIQNHKVDVKKVVFKTYCYSWDAEPEFECAKVTLR